MAAPLTVDEVRALALSPLRHGYWAECVAYPPDFSRAFWLGAHPATTPRLALRWLRARAQDVADQLDPVTRLPLLGWLLDQHEHQRAMTALTRGDFYSITAVDDGVRYLLSARPTRTGNTPHHPPDQPPT